MKFIDKSSHEGKAIKLLDQFMQERWVVEESAYVNVSYETLRDKNPLTQKPYRKELEDIISENQNGLCCYCMRKIGDDETKTLEHIIPEGLDGKTDKVSDKKEFDKYINYNLPFLTKDNFVLSFVFKEENIKRAPPFPHDISYHNLVLSCDGKYPVGPRSRSAMTCNHKRDQDEIYPVFFDSVLSQAVEYDNAGEIFANAAVQESDKTKIVGFIVAANLSFISLRCIRYLWYLVRHVPLADLKAVAKDGDDVSVSVFVASIVEGTTEMDKEVLKVFNSIEAWNTFLRYEWFKSYYETKYP